MSLSPPLIRALLRALWAGHPSQRPRVVKALGRLDEATLSSEPVAGTFRRLLGGESDALVRGVGELVARKRLSVYAEDLVALLSASRERREWAQAWLKRLPLGPSARSALVALAAGEAGSRETRLSALLALCPPRRVWARSAAADLDPEDRERLLPALADEALHPALLRVWGEVDEAFVEAAIGANATWGQGLYAARVGPGGLWAKLFPARPSSLGVWPGQGLTQQSFLLGIARLAAAAKARRWLAALHEYLHVPGFGPLLARTYGEEVIREVAAPILSQDSNFSSEERARVSVEVLGRLGERRAAIKLRTLLPPPHAAPGALGGAVLVALARLGDAEAVEPHLKAVLSRLEHHLRRGQAVPQDLGDPCHPSALAPGLQAATELEDARFAFPAFGLLGHETPLNAAAGVLPQLLARLQLAEVLGKEELALVSRLRVTLVPDAGDTRAPTEFAQAAAIETIRLARLAELTPTLTEFACGAPSAALLAAAARALAGLAGPDDAESIQRVLFEASLEDVSTLRLWTALSELRLPDELVETAERLLREGRGGRRAQEAALRWLADELPPGRFLRLCLGLIRSPHGAVRTRALREAVRGGLFRELTRLDDELDLGAEPAARPPSSDLIGDLLATASEAFAARENDDDAGPQVRVLLDALLPLAGRGALDGDETRVLRGRLRAFGAWTEVATFHSMHRELLELEGLQTPPGGEAGEGEDEARGERLELGLLHAIVLRGLAEGTFAHPTSAKRQRYWGPLPRVEQVWASSSPFVQLALYEVLSSPDYLQTDALWLRCLGSPRAVVRSAALGRLSRQACLVQAEQVLGRLTDPDPRVRRALVSVLRTHELARHGSALTGLLKDPDEATRLLATRTLAEWGDPSCLEALTDFLASEDDGLRAEAVSALRAFDPSLLGGILAKQIRIESPRAAAAALAALRPERFPSDPGLGDAVFRVAALGSGPLRARALRFLPALAEPGRIAEVVPLLRDEDANVRRAARDVLRRRDGRRLAPAVAAAAVAVRSSDQRLEILGLLADLGVPEASQGLVPLLLDESPAVRDATRRALSAGRAFSRAPQLAELLLGALEAATDPTILAELVRLLDDEAALDDPLAVEWWLAALGCEEPGVWRAALRAARRRETTPEARAQSVIVDRLEACLSASPAPDAGVLGLALREVERREVGERPAIRKAVVGLAEDTEGRGPALRRKALALLCAWGAPEASSAAEALVARASAGAAEREAALAAEAKRLKQEKPWYRGRVGTPSERRELSRARAEVVGGERVLLSLASRTDDSSFGARARQIPALVAKSRVLNEAICAEAAARWRAAQSFDVVRATESLPGPDPNRPRWRGFGTLLPPLRVLARLRDRLEPSEWLARAEGLPQAVRGALDPLQRLSALAYAPSLDLGPWRAAISTAPADDHSLRQAFENLETFVLACMESWRPELKVLFPELVKAGQRWHDLRPKDRWGQRDRQGRELAERYAAAQLRLGVEGLIPGLVELAGEDELALRILCAQNEVGALVERLKAASGTSQVAARLTLTRLLVEIGDAAAVAALEARALDDDPRVRAVVAEAAWRVLPSAREPLVALLSAFLEDPATLVKAAALRALGRLGLVERAGAVEAALLGEGQGFDDAAAAACEAACALGLVGQVGALLARVEDGRAQPRQSVLSALEALAGPKDASQIVARIAACEGNATRIGLAQILEGVWETHGDPADAVGESLSRQLTGEPGRWLVVLRLLARAGHEPSAAALVDLLVHPAEAVRAAAASAAGRLGGSKASIDDALRARLDEGQEATRVRGGALQSLARRREPHEARRLLADYRSVESFQVSVLCGIAWAGLPEPVEIESLGWDPARWALGLLVAEVAPGLEAPGPDETPFALAQRLGFGGRDLPIRVREITASEAARSEAGRGWLAGAPSASGRSRRAARRLTSKGLEAIRLLTLPGAEAERDLAELVLLSLAGTGPAVTIPALRVLDEGAGEQAPTATPTPTATASLGASSAAVARLQDQIQALSRPLQHSALFERLSELDPALALDLLPTGSDSQNPVLWARLLCRAAGEDLEAWRAPVSELLLHAQDEVRWAARVALAPQRLDPHQPARPRAERGPS